MANEALGQCHRVALRPLQPQCQRPSPANREKRFEGTGCCTRELPSKPQRRQQIRVAHGDDPAEQVRVPTDELRHRVHSHVGPERQWTLIERRSEGVVHAQDRATLPRSGADGVQVSHRQQRVRRRLQPNQVGHAAQLDPAFGVGHGDAMHGPPAAALASFSEPRDTLVAIIWQGHDRACGELIENRRDPRHAGGEGDRRATFEAADDLFQCLPSRRAVVARVRTALAQHEIRRRARRHV